MKSHHYFHSRNRIHIAELTLSFLTRTVELSGTVIETTGLEFNLLALLMSDAGSIVSREAIATHIFNRDIKDCNNSINCHMVNLRKKLKHGSAKAMIKTVTGKGYMIVPE